MACWAIALLADWKTVSLLSLLTLGLSLWMKRLSPAACPDLGRLRSVEAWVDFATDPDGGLSESYGRLRVIDQGYPLCYLLMFCAFFLAFELPHWIMLLPLAAATFDYAENALIVRAAAAARAGELRAEAVNRVRGVIAVKWACVVGSGVVWAFGLIRWGVG